MSYTTRLARGLLAIAAVGTLFAAPAAAATAASVPVAVPAVNAAPAPAPAATCADADAAGPCTDRCRRIHEDGLRGCDVTYNRCLRSGQNPAKCRERRLDCRANAEKRYRDCLATCTRRTA